MDNAFKFELIWSDIHALQVRVSAWNGAFGGTADVYVAIGGLAEAALQLEGFPRSLSDERELQFGALGPDSAGRAVKMRFYCKGAAGHCFVEAWFESEHDASRLFESAHLISPVEAWSVDNFISELRFVEAKTSGVAHLETAVRG